MSTTKSDNQTALPATIPVEQTGAAPVSQTSPAAAALATKPKAKASAKNPVAKKTMAAVRKPATDAASAAPVKPVLKTIVSKPLKAKKTKLVRDSFTIPKPEYLVLEELKARAVSLANPVKKTELLRAGIKALAAMADASFLAALKAVPVIKTGRPTKD